MHLWNPSSARLPRACGRSGFVAARVERVDGARFVGVALYAVQKPEEVSSRLQVRHRDVLELRSGHVLVYAVEQGEERVVRLHFFLIVARDLVEPELDICDLGRDCVDGCIGPAGEIAHRLCGIDLLRAGYRGRRFQKYQ
jgi:hypothetical protein